MTNTSINHLAKDYWGESYDICVNNTEGFESFRDQAAFDHVSPLSIAARYVIQKGCY